MAIPRNLANLANQLNSDGEVPKIEVGDSSVAITDTGSNGTITFTTDGTARGNFNSSGNLQLVNNISVGNATPTTSGTGITFPATASASTDANTLDDYEEGSWTPVDSSGAGLTFTSPGGRYCKVGRVVYFAFRAQYPSTASGSQAIIGGLPFSAISSVSNGYDMGGFCISGNSPATSYKGLIDLSATTIGRINSMQSNSDVNVTNANLSTFNLYFWGWYYADA